MIRFDGKVVFITGAAQGQGLSHAIRFAEAGADIVAVDLRNLDDAIAGVQQHGRKIVARIADVADLPAMEAVAEAAIAVFGRIDIVIANAAICRQISAPEMTAAEWRDVIDTNLTGSFWTCKATMRHIIAGGQGGCILLIGSVAGVRPAQNMASYVSAKHGLTGLMGALAMELAPHRIRVNAILPAMVDTQMLHNPATYAHLGSGREDFSREEFGKILMNAHLLPIPWLDSADISNAALFLASEQGRYITGVNLPVDAGMALR